MRLPPIFYHCFKHPVPYKAALELQERIHRLQLLARKASGNHRDFLILLEHRPVYTFGRRQGEDDDSRGEALKLEGTGADCVFTPRGGQTTYHGPGQITGYPLIDLGRTSPPMGIRDYICRMQKLLETHLAEEHGIKHAPMRHRLTSHGFALNVTAEPLAWFNRVVACGLTDVKAGCISDVVRSRKGIPPTSIHDELPGLITRFGRSYGREMVPLDISMEGDAEDAIRAVIKESTSRESWLSEPLGQS
ncbi:lipoyltransferase [Lenzites betulinus]|nr:lipoyltransferase [Lenzites betulinus]